MKKLLFIVSVLVYVLTACNEKPQNIIEENAFPEIFPDYKQAEIPVNIAPLNFRMKENASNMVVLFHGNKGDLKVNGKSSIDIPIKKWHQLLEANSGDSISVSVTAKMTNGWKSYRSFSIRISPNPIDPYLAYRLIAPGYETWSKMGIYQRNLTNFDQSSIINNRQFPGACMNCHSFKQNCADSMMFHLRMPNGGTVIIQNKAIKKILTKTDQTQFNCVYPYWHPSGNYIAFSVNNISQYFHTNKDNRIEVVDSESDVVVYDIRKNELLSCKLLKTKDYLETFPSFSTDGKTLFFCSAKSKELPSEYKEIRYNLCRISFNSEDGTFGDKIDTLYNASVKGKSVTFPRPSPDGKYIMFTLADYGNFSIWHKEADLYLLDLKSGVTRSIDEVNSNDTESYHSWSSNSRWFVFSSRRIDGLYTRPFIASIDEKGKIGKPFLLPQENPDFYMDLMESFNIPEFVTGKVDVDPDLIENMIQNNKGKQVENLKMR